jgi:hypothetical protein
LGHWGRIIAVSTIMWGPWLTSMAQADVPTANIFSVLSHLGPPPVDTNLYAQNVAVKKVLQRLVKKPDGSFDAAYASRLGFDLPLNDPPGFVQQAQASFPIAVFRIGLRRLQQYQPGHPVQGDLLALLAADTNWLFVPPPSLFLAPQRFLYAITILDNVTNQPVVHSSVRVRIAFSSVGPIPVNLDNAIERIGSGALIRQVDKWRRNPNTTGPINPDYFLVWIPALDRYYLGRFHDKDLRITAITDDPQVGLKEGKEDDAREVFQKLKAEAVTINADDPDAPPR